MKERKIILIAFITLLVSFAAIFFLLPMPKTPDIAMPWEAKKVNNQVVVFGLTLEKSTLKNAMQTLGTEVEVALFKEKNKEHAIEVYFNNTNIGGLGMRVILALNTSKQDLEILNNNIKDYETLPSGNEKVEFNDFALNSLLGNTIKNLSFIPKTTLDDEVIISRFGIPEIQQSDRWIYPEQGLTIVRDNTLTIFEYQNQ